MSPACVDEYMLYGMTIATESSTIREYARSRVAGRLRHINIHGAKAKIIACKAWPVLAVHLVSFLSSEEIVCTAQRVLHKMTQARMMLCIGKYHGPDLGILTRPISVRQRTESRDTPSNRPRRFLR